MNCGTNNELFRS